MKEGSHMLGKNALFSLVMPILIVTSIQERNEIVGKKNLIKIKSSAVKYG